MAASDIGERGDEWIVTVRSSVIPRLQRVSRSNTACTVAYSSVESARLRSNTCSPSSLAQVEANASFRWIPQMTKYR